MVILIGLVSLAFNGSKTPRKDEVGDLENLSTKQEEEIDRLREENIALKSIIKNVRERENESYRNFIKDNPIKSSEHPGRRKISEQGYDWWREQD